MDLRQLASLAAKPEAEEKILAPALDDPTLAEAIEKLRAGGHVVIVEMPGTEAHRGELGCTRKLEKKEGRWHVT